MDKNTLLLIVSCSLEQSSAFAHITLSLSGYITLFLFSYITLLSFRYITLLLYITISTRPRNYRYTGAETWHSKFFQELSVPI